MDGKATAKVLLTRLGSVCSSRAIYNLNGVFNYLHVGWWLRAHGFRPSSRVSSRDELFRRIAAEVAERQVLYLEFGVAQGSSIRRWSELLHNPRSALHGFDSFLGLPHDWSIEGHERGYFSTGGRPPEIDDPRVPGSYLYFDQFHHRCDELRAFAELLDENPFSFQLLAASQDLSNVAFKRIA